MQKLATLKKRRDFILASKQGQFIATAGLILQKIDNQQSNIQIGYTVTIKVCNAVTRNKAKRRLRALVAKNAHMFKKGNNYVLLARHATPNRDFKKLNKDLIFAINNV